MCNCQRPPPHVHCKVYKVRQNKENPANKKRAEKDPDVVYPALATAIPLKKEVPIPESVVKVETQRQVHPEMSLATMPRIPSLTIMDSCLVQPTRDDSGKQVEGSNWDGFQSGWGDAPNVWNDSTTDIPGIQNSDWLTQLNLTILDNTQQPTATYPSSITEATEVTDPSIPSHLSLSETLRMYFETYGDPSDFTRSTIEKQILERVEVMQVKAGKCDVLFKMLDSFNQNSLHVTVTWRLIHNIGENCINGSVFPGLYTIIKHYPSILFTLGSTTDYSDNAETSPNGKIIITFLNTSTVIGIKPLCTSVALMDNCFRRFAEVEVSESWSHGNQTWTAIGNIDTKKLKEMITFGENAERILAQAANPCRICVSMNLQNDANYFEKLPLLSVILKRVVSEYPDVVFTLYRMSCQNHMVNCVVEFSETKNWVSIINSYEANIVVWEYKEDSKDEKNYQLLLDL